jgi:hypothetical protein
VKRAIGGDIQRKRGHPLTDAISDNSLGQGVVTSESLNELVNPVRAEELLSRANTAQLDHQYTRHTRGNAGQVEG